jgi:4-hydroxybenzoate polyprenyltransferase
MKKIRAYATAAHFGPTMIVTTIALTIALVLGTTPKAIGIAFTVFLGQLIIGWSNDIYDHEDDLKHHRTNKPLVGGTIAVPELTRATFIFTPIAIIANLIGPLGLKGGSVYLLGVGCGVAYNFYFKFSLLSPLPYAIACAALPASVFYGLHRTPPFWILLTGSLLGVAFHFLNVLKDLSQDRESAIGGLPQRLGKGKSVFITVLLGLSAVAVLLSALLFGSNGSEKKVDVALAPIPYVLRVPASIAPQLSVVDQAELPERDFTKVARADGVRASVLVNYLSDNGEKVLFMGAYYFSTQDFAKTENPNEPPRYGTKTVVADNIVLSIAGPHDSIFEPDSADGKRITSLYELIYKPESYLKQ